MCWIGIDVGKTALEVAATLPSPPLPRTVSNDATGFARLVPLLIAAAPTLVVLEATGTYHRPLLCVLLTAGIPTAVVNPAQVVAFRASRLGREKTDRSDAKLLARFAAVHGEDVHRAVPADPIQARLRDLVAYREGQVAERTRLKNRLHANGFGGDPWVRTRLTADLTEVETRLAEVEREITRVLAEVPEARVVQTVIGVGPTVAAAVLAAIPAAIWGDAKAAAAYAGVHPKREQSGQRDHSRLSKQGHAAVRRSLFMAATVAVQHDPVMTAFHDRLVGKGHRPKSALCAVMHKVLRHMMGEIRAYRAAHAPSLLPADT